MLNILFIGDSLTWSSDPSTGIRRDITKRWTTKIAKKHPIHNFTFIGVPGMGAGVDPWDNSNIYSSKGFIYKAIYSQWPLDFIFIFLGTNNIVSNRKKTKEDIVNEIMSAYTEAYDASRHFMEKYKALNKKINMPKIFLVSPPRFDIELDINIDEFFKHLSEKTESNNIEIINLSMVHVNSKDGIHLSEKNEEEVYRIINKNIDKMNV